MNEKDKTLFPPYRSGYWIAWCFLISGFILTGFTAYIIKLKIDADLKHEFEIECNEIKKSISVRLSAHAQLLRGGASYLMSDEYVSREEWKSYIENGKIDKNLPGIQGMGFSLIVPKVQLTRHIQEIRKEGFPEYKMFPEGNREIYTSVIYLEPFSGKNLRAFGYDMYSEPVRRAAMEQSRDSNTAMLSGKVRLVQEGDEEVQAGTLMYVPVYKEGMPVNTVEERRLAIMGWVYNPYRMNDLMLGILGGWDLQSENRIRLQIYDGDILTTETLLFDTKTGDTVSVKETLNQLLPIDFNGKHWTLNLSGADLHSSYLNFIYAFLICGIVISILIFFLIKSMLNTRIRAVEIAEGLTADIQESEAKFRQLIENSHDIIFTISVDGVFTFVSKSWTNLLGHTIKEVVGQPFQKFVHSDDIPMCTAFLQKIIETGKRQEGIDFRVRHKNGKWLWQTSNVINITNETGIVVALEGIAHDITERKLAEEELHKSEERYRLILKNSFESVYLFDEYSKQIVDANPAFLKLSGYAIEEARTLTLYDIVAEEHSSIDRNITKVLSGTGFSMGERRWKRKDGTIVIVEASASKFIQNGKTVIFISGRDISERKQTEKIIRDNEIYLKKTQTIANLGTYTMDLTSGKWSSSEILEDIFGIETDYDKSGEGWISLIHPEWQKIISDYFHQVISDKKAKFDKEYKIIRNKDKTEHWVHDVGELRLNENGEPVEMVGIIQDITERKQVEEILKKSEEKFKTFFDKSSSGIFLMDFNRKLITVNESFAQMHGYTVEEMQGLDLSVIDIPEETQRIPERIEKLLNGETLKFEVKHFHKLGNIIIQDVVTSLLNIDNKDYILAFHYDITIRKQAEEVLEKWNTQFHKLSSNAPGLIFQFTRRPNGTYHVPIASEGIREIFGCAPEDVAEDFSPIAKVIYPDDMERVIAEIEYSANNLTYFTCEFRVQIPGKEIQWVYSNSSPEKLPDGSITWYGFNTDITEQKQVQQELILAKEKAEESDRLKSAFLTNMSHEIRTPMNGILGFSELLKEPHLTGEEQEKFINIIEKSGRRMLNTINDIINISKIEAKQMNLLMSLTNIKDHIESIQIFFKSEAEKKGIQILIKENLPAKDSLVNTDSDKVYGILTNLVSNAIKFTKEGYVEIGCKKKENLLEFYVKDTGAGIEQEHKEIIFERFRQGSEGLSRGYEGSGLGLSISKAFVEILGGKIWVESEAGKGSTFYFTIPYSVENSSSFSHGGLSPRRICDTERAVNSVKLEPEIKKLKILIAEDDETSRMYISLIVKMYSKEILTAQNGIEAVDICRNNPDIDLIMMDIKMPAMDGDEATKQIRQFNKTVVIIAQTAFALKGDRERLIKSGCNDYMTKPVNRNLLGELIIKYFK
ncbi:MAG: PAS domain S-box protein [Ignavibacteria bacterium]